MYRVMRARAIECLAKCVPGLEPAGEMRWSFALANGRALPVTALIEEGWLALEAPLEEAAAGTPLFRLLEWNGQLDGPGKFVAVSGGALQLRAEIALDEAVDIAGRLHQSCAGFRAALGRSHGESPAAHAVIGPGPIEAGGAQLRQALGESGWAFTERAGGRLAVELEAREGFYQALVEQRGVGGVRLWVELARAQALSAASRQALGLLLLTAGGALRPARGAAEAGDGQMALRLEVDFATPPGAAELGHALAALSVGCRLCGEEVKLLEDESIAGRYLRIRHSSTTEGENL